MTKFEFFYSTSATDKQTSYAVTNFLLATTAYHIPEFYCTYR